MLQLVKLILKGRWVAMVTICIYNSNSESTVIMHYSKFVLNLQFNWHIRLKVTQQINNHIMFLCVFLIIG